MILQAIKQVFVQLTGTLEQISQEQYGRPCITLSNATIGQHVRHIIELFQCLEQGYDSGIVNYEKRKRDNAIETNKNLAIGLINEIYNTLDRPNKGMTLENCYDELSAEPVTITTNYHREVAYNLEHTIHHMALIRIGINEVSSVLLPETFGVAPSTTKYKQACVQ